MEDEESRRDIDDNRGALGALSDDCDWIGGPLQALHIDSGRLILVAASNSIPSPPATLCRVDVLKCFLHASPHVGTLDDAVTKIPCTVRMT